jgi:hypothetical protein
MNRSSKVLRALLITAALVAPVALGAPAHASTTSNGCTVDPTTPYHNGDFSASGIKRIAYEIEVTCSAGLTVTIEQQRWEDDPNQSDDLIGTSTLVSTFASTTTITRTVTANLSDTDDFTDHYEEAYQKVRFRVTNGPVTSAWTNWESSGIRAIHV